MFAQKGFFSIPINTDYEKISNTDTMTIELEQEACTNIEEQSNIGPVLNVMPISVIRFHIQFTFCQHKTVCSVL